ncbi:hypothetical protein DAEQUDRAFT_742056 [Daedalea quercina L-15889]|uniref:Uncharacterized protein n=1 Tax=Daedalea quercina L-15889 TaxID=1314783 RepID=A0A165KJ46_9APHY|nr:hypothetical protein DAEQUDRAFT_742056 [Daedalea quercina L-15889]
MLIVYKYWPRLEANCQHCATSGDDTYSPEDHNTANKLGSYLVGGASHGEDRLGRCHINVKIFVSRAVGDSGRSELRFDTGRPPVENAVVLRVTAVPYRAPRSTVAIQDAIGFSRSPKDSEDSKATWLDFEWLDYELIDGRFGYDSAAKVMVIECFNDGCGRMTLSLDFHAKCSEGSRCLFGSGSALKYGQ